MSTLQSDLQFAPPHNQYFPVPASELASTGFFEVPSVEDFDFISPPSNAEPLIPSQESWPFFDFSCFDSSTPSPDSSLSLEYPPSPGDSPSTTAGIAQDASPSTLRVPSTSRPRSRSRSPNHVPRPRNAFMIFRARFLAEQKISKAIERDHRHISRIIAHCWNNLPESEKNLWRGKADAEKVEHALKYPGYRFAPVNRVQKPAKRQVKRNGEEEMRRCRLVAELLLAGKEGDELESAVKMLDVSPVAEIGQQKKKTNLKAKGKGKNPKPVEQSATPVLGREPANQEEGHIDVPIFRSPLLPPSDLPQPLQASKPQSAIDLNAGSTSEEATAMYQQYQLTGQFPIMQSQPASQQLHYNYQQYPVHPSYVEYTPAPLPDYPTLASTPGCRYLSSQNHATDNYSGHVPQFFNEASAFLNDGPMYSFSQPPLANKFPGHDNISPLQYITPPLQYNEEILFQNLFAEQLTGSLQSQPVPAGVDTLNRSYPL